MNDRNKNFEWLEKTLPKTEMVLRSLKGISNLIRIEQSDLSLLEVLQQDFIEKNQSARESSPLHLHQTRDNLPTKKEEREPVVCATENFLEMVQKSKNLDTLRLKIHGCEHCPLSLERQSIVFGQGNQHADLIFIGEGPGEEEDNSGLAFVGRAGKLLTQIILAMGISRESVYICNVVKCRPPGNRTPLNPEIQQCFPILQKQIQLVKPKLIVTLGNVATKNLLKTTDGIMKLRGNVYQYMDIPLIPTFHPSFLLRTPQYLGVVWDDMRLIRQHLFRKNNQ